MAVQKTGIRYHEISFLNNKVDQETDQFEAIFQENWPRVYALLVRLVGDQAEAEDLALEVFMRLYQHPPRQDVELNLGGWLHRVAMNLGLNALRSWQSRRQYEDKAGRFELQENSSLSPEEIFAAQEERRSARCILAEMNPRQAQILILRYSGLAYRDIATIMGLAPSSVGPLLTRAEAEFEKRFGTKEMEAER